MQFEEQIRANRQDFIADVFRRLEIEAQPFAAAFQEFLVTLFQSTLPDDWRARWHDFVSQQAQQEVYVERESVVEIEEWIEARARIYSLLPPAREPADAHQRVVKHSGSTTYIELPPGYPTPEEIAAAKAWEQLQKLLIEDLSAERTRQVREAADEYGRRLRASQAARQRAERRLSALHSGVDGFVSGLMTLKAAITRDAADIAARDEEFRRLGIDQTVAAQVSKFAAAVAVDAATAAAILAAGGVALAPYLRAFAAYAPKTAAAAGYAAQGLGVGLAGYQGHAAYRAYAAGKTDEAINRAADALVLTILALAGPLAKGARAMAARRPKRIPTPDAAVAEEVRFDATHPLIEGSPDPNRSRLHRMAQQIFAEVSQELGFYQRVAMNTSLSKFSGLKHRPDIKPDIMGLTVDGKIDMIEIKSPSQSKGELITKLEKALEQLPENMRGEITVIDPMDAFK